MQLLIVFMCVELQLDNTYRFQCGFVNVYVFLCVACVYRR